MLAMIITGRAQQLYAWFKIEPRFPANARVAMGDELVLSELLLMSNLSLLGEAPAGGRKIMITEKKKNLM